MIDSFIEKNLESRFATEWFPRKFRHGYDTRFEEVYVENKANTERMRNSPLNYFRRRLNKRNI